MIRTGMELNFNGKRLIGLPRMKASARYQDMKKVVRN
jgi:hypothetical protein